MFESLKRLFRRRTPDEPNPATLERAHAAGVTIAAGSDAGFLVDHGENACELEELVKGGFTSNEAIRAATGSAAKLLGLSDEIGSLGAGKLADVLVQLRSGGLGFDKDTPVIIHAGDLVRWDQVVNAFNAARRAGYASVNFGGPRSGA